MKFDVHWRVRQFPTIFYKRDKEHVAYVLGHAGAEGYAIERFVYVPNVHAEPWHDFATTRHWKAIAMWLAEKRGCTVIGIAHTHIGGKHENEPSENDITQLKYGLGLVLHVRSGTIHVYEKAGRAGELNVTDLTAS